MHRSHRLRYMDMRSENFAKIGGKRYRIAEQLNLGSRAFHRTVAPCRTLQKIQTSSKNSKGSPPREPVEWDKGAKNVAKLRLCVAMYRKRCDVASQN